MHPYMNQCFGMFPHMSGGGLPVESKVIGNCIAGYTQEMDVKKIVERGARFPLDVALKLI